MYLLRLMLLRAWAVIAVVGFGVEVVMSVAFAANAAQPRSIEQSSQLPAATPADLSVDQPPRV